MSLKPAPLQVVLLFPEYMFPYLLNMVLPIAKGAKIVRCSNGGRHAALVLVMPGDREVYLGELGNPSHVETVRTFILHKLRGEAQQQLREALSEATYLQRGLYDLGHSVYTVQLRLQMGVLIQKHFRPNTPVQSFVDVGESMWQFYQSEDYYGI